MPDLIQTVTQTREQLVSIPAGLLHMRDDRIDRRWSATVAEFQLAKYPVTQAQYGALTGKFPSTATGAGLPVESVSWLDCVRYCNLLSQAAALTECYEINGDKVLLDPKANGYRLPSEAEWEHACRATSGAVRYGDINDIAWYHGNSDGHIHPVGEKSPNHWGLYDMLGNVWEWCWDIYDPEVYGSYRIFRGGGWNDKPRGVLASNRRRSHPIFAIDDLGFRVARNAPLAEIH